jgi:hypothetical protein
MLVGHSQVETAGELNWFDRLGAQLETLSAKLIPQLRSEYLRVLTAKSGHAAYIIDKMPNNFLYVGQILTLFPNARLIHLKRSPLDVCRSIYFQHFPAGQYYANDLEDLGDYYQDYHSLMDHWRKCVPESIIELEYEQLVRQPEKQLRALLKRVQLGWEDQCLSPHRSAGAVVTASAAQIRQPINTHGIGRAAAYAEYFAPIANRIGLDQGVN